MYTFVVGQHHNPLAALNGCKKHGDSIWACCDCNPRYYASVYNEDTGYETRRRDDFTSFELATKWAEEETKRINKEIF